MPPKRKQTTISIVMESVQSSTSVEPSVLGVGQGSQDLPPETAEESGLLFRRSSTRMKKKSVFVEPVPPGMIDLGNESPLTDIEDEEVSQEEVKSPPKKRRRKKDPEPIFYDIPPVVTKETTFKGLFTSHSTML